MFLQTRLENEIVTLEPLQAADFEALYQVASDPLIWEQHPNPDRYKKEVFETFFKGALESKGAFKIIDTAKNAVIGSTRYYDLDYTNSLVYIGYTFLSRNHWGTKFNKAAKILLIDHAFTQVDSVYFHIGALNKRSQIAIERLGALKVKEIEVKYYGEAPKLNFEYQITTNAWNIFKQSL